MASAFFTLLTGLFLLLCFYFYLRYNHWKRNGIPTAKGYVPILGHLLPVAMKRIHFVEFIRKVYNEHKDYSMVGIYNGTMPSLILREPNLVKTVLQSNFSSFHENAFKVDPNMDPLSAKDPFFSTGNAWLNGRKRLTYAFTNVRLKVLLVAVNGVCKKFEDFLNRQLETKNKYEVELKLLFLRFTGEVVANAGLGIEGHCFEDETTPSAFDQLTGNTLGVSLTTLVWQYFPAIGRPLKLKLVPKEIDQFFRKVVAENLEIRRREPIYRNDFLQLMIDMGKTGEKVDEEVITAHAFSLYLNGTETSSLTLSYVGYDLAARPEIQE
ncbi:probable cytochrome P450 28d1, partial [Bombus impatiens]|uniref:Probable cytochrome P450 28d1 n=1 Tax=Bombus impatiens TaxID=132113 RepID=A0A6P3DMX5_BOMIM